MIDLPPPDPGIEVTVASRGMSKGIAQTEGPQIVPRTFVQLGALQVGGQWKNVSSSAASGEGAAFVNLARGIAGFQLNAGVSYKFQTDVKEPTDDRSWEFSGGISRKFGKAALRASIVYSPDDLGSAKQSIYLEGGPTFDLTKTVKLSASVGHRSRVDGPDYTSFGAGISKTLFRGVTADLRWYDSNRHDLGEFYKGRAVISTKLAF